MEKSWEGLCTKSGADRVFIPQKADLLTNVLNLYPDSGSYEVFMLFDVQQDDMDRWKDGKQ